MANAPPDRYHRQMLLEPVGIEGQRRLAASRVLLVGCGALGTHLADQLVRAGVGFLRIADRDLVETTNLQRQVLFDEEDARQSLPKPIAAARRLHAINSTVIVNPWPLDVHSGNIEELMRTPQGPVQMLLDGTDNVATRYLINDVAVKHGIPWVYGGCVGTEGVVAPIIPGHTPCLRCLFPQPPNPADLPTCDTAGVLGAAAAVVASIQAALVLKLLLGQTANIAPQMISFDLWELRFRAMDTAQARREDCPCCGQRKFEFLDEPPQRSTVALCGRNAVQIRPPRAVSVDLAMMGARLASVGRVEQTPFFLRCALADESGIVLTLFPDGRLLVGGTSDLARARSVAAKYIGA